MFQTAARFGVAVYLRKGVIHQDAAHLLAGDGEKMPSALNFERLRADQSGIRLMDQSGGL